MGTQLLQDITTRLGPFLPQLEADLSGFSEAAEHGIRFLATLVGQFYPILHVVKEREATRLPCNTPETETSRNNQIPSALTVSSNFELQSVYAIFDNFHHGSSGNSLSVL
ncbi:unnamed protein product [Cuscuta europaea]|uniref:Uncharacterized protein n=1 Tax=Cuscuta europaea TaxID=41803 RepID=A0A9P1ECB6_CUSEU|nr:unnamed protein product [Cuscuta europaea]